MIINVESQETANLLRQLCDVALKAGGLQNMNAVLNILNSIRIDPSLTVAKDKPEQLPFVPAAKNIKDPSPKVKKNSDM